MGTTQAMKCEGFFSSGTSRPPAPSARAQDIRVCVKLRKIG